MPSFDKLYTIPVTSKNRILGSPGGRYMNSRNRALALAMLVSLSAMSAAAQTASSTEGTINGTITDSSGAVLPGVRITLSGSAVMGTPVTTTDQNGAYRFPALAPGDYKLVFEQTGFGSVTREGIRITLGFTATVNVEMKPGAVSENVTVTGESPVIDVQSNSVSTSLDAGKMAS